MFSDRLAQCQSAVLAEEVLSSTRHNVRNKLATIANAAQYLATRAKTTDIWSADPRMARFFGLIETNVREANDLLESREALERAFHPHREPVSIAASIDEALGLAGVEAKQELPATPIIDADAAEITLLISALLAHVTATGDHDAIRLSATEGEDRVVTIRVAAPLRAGAQGDGSLPLAIARRIGRRYAAAITAEASEGTVAVSVVLTADC